MARSINSLGQVSFVLAACAAGLVPAAAIAQNQVRREQSEPARVETEPRKPSIEIQTDKALGRDDCALERSDIRVNLRNIGFEGAGGAPVKPELVPLLQGLQPDEAGDQPISVVCQIRDRINGALAASGFVARAQVPAQELQDGTLRLVIVAGRVVEVRVRGDMGRFGGTLENRLERIRTLDPFNKTEAIRILLLANDIPGLKVKMSLRNAGGAPGDLIADVEASATSALVLANVQNFGSRQLGREVATLRGEFYGLTGLADRTYLSVSNSLQWSEIHIGQLGHDFALNDRGMRLGARISLAQSEPDIKNLDLQSRSLIAGLELSMPVHKGLNSELGVTLGGEVLNQATRVLSSNGKIPFTHDQIRVGFVRFDGGYRKLDRSGVPLFRLDGTLELRKGFDIFGATKVGQVEDQFAPSRFEGDAEATVVRGEIMGEVIPVPNFTLAGKAFGQWANKPLLNLEEFSIGNFTYGRGYDPGANGGDRALAARFEPRLRLGKFGPIDAEVTGFYDIVHLRNLDNSAGSEASRTFHSTGGGLRFVLRDRPSGEMRAIFEVGYAKPLDKALLSDLKKPTDRVLVSLTTKLWPWGSR